jgi:hypothetical protein
MKKPKMSLCELGFKFVRLGYNFSDHKASSFKFHRDLWNTLEDSKEKLKSLVNIRTF